MDDFDWHHPVSLDAVQQHLRSGAVLLAGGQSLVPQLRAKSVQPRAVVALSRLKGMDGITQTEAGLTLGAMATHRQIAEQTAYPALADLAGRLGDPAVRSRGTIGGAVAFHDPSGCYIPALLASNATIRTTAREISASVFFTGRHQTALTLGEVILEIDLPIPKRASYVKFQQPAARWPLVGVFAAQYDDGMRIGITGVAQAGAFRWRAGEQALQAGSVSLAQVPLDGDVPAGGLMDTHIAPAAYRAHLASVLTKRALASLGLSL